MDLGGPELATAIEAVEYGAFKYLLKPIMLRELVTTVRRALRVRELAMLKREALMLIGGGATGEDSGRAGLEASFDRAFATPNWM